MASVEQIWPERVNIGPVLVASGQLRTLQTRMTLRLGKWRPRGSEDDPHFARRTSRRVAKSWAIAEILAWDTVVASTWWRWAGHVGRLCQADPWRWVSRVAQ